MSFLIGGVYWGWLVFYVMKLEHSIILQVEVHSRVRDRGKAFVVLALHTL